MTTSMGTKRFRWGEDVAVVGAEPVDSDKFCKTPRRPAAGEHGDEVDCLAISVRGTATPLDPLGEGKCLCVPILRRQRGVAFGWASRRLSHTALLAAAAGWSSVATASTRKSSESARRCDSPILSQFISNSGTSGLLNKV